MAKLNISFANIPAGHLEPGDYEGVIGDVTLKTSSNSGGQYLDWQIHLTGENVGQQVRLMTSLQESGLWKLRDTCLGLGMEFDELELDVDEESGLVLSPKFSGIPVIASLEVDEYRGRKRNSVVSIVVDGEAEEGDDLGL